MNNNQYGFTPQRSTIDAAMAVKNFVEKGLAAGDVIVLVSLDVKAAFDAAWWPSILNGLKACGCPKNLYNLTKSYFSQQTAGLSTNSIRMEKKVSKGCSQGSCCGPGFWCIMYNSVESQIHKANQSRRVCRQLNTGSQGKQHAKQKFFQTVN
jgi:hypothetical protein